VIADHLRAYPILMLKWLVTAGCRVRPLCAAERDRDASPALRHLGVDVDVWQYRRLDYSSLRSARYICAHSRR